MGAVAAVFGDAVGAIFEPIKQVGNIVESAVREVGHAVESVGREVGKIGEAAAKDPAGTMLKVAAVASGQWWALPLVSAGLVIAHGGDIGQAALAGGIALASAGAAYGIGEALGAGSSAALDMGSADAVNLANQGLTSSQIAQVLGQSYPEIGMTALNNISEMASMGIAASEIASDVGAQMAVQNLGASTAANAVGSGTRTALSGGSLSDILSSAGTAGLGTGVGGATSLGLGAAGAGSTIAGAIGKGVGAATASAVAGKDGTSAFLNSLINTSLSETGGQVKNMLKNAWNSVTSSVNDYNSQLDKTNSAQAAIEPLRQTALEAENAVNAALDEYKPIRDKFSDLTKQYDAAKAAGDVKLANSLADQANAMIPELDAATQKYNDAYNNSGYETKKSQFETALESYKADTAKTDQLKAGYEKTSEQLTAEAKKLTDAAGKVVTMPEPVQNAFAKMYQSGTDIDTALANSDKLNGMSTIAQETFNRDIATSNNTDAAFEFANKVNALDTKQQTAFQTGITTGLDNKTAFEVAPVIANYDTRQQQAYAGAVKEGFGKEGADLISAFASFAPEQTTQTSTTAAPAALSIDSAYTKMSPEEQLKYKELVNDPTRPMTPGDALKAVSDFFISKSYAENVPANVKDAVWHLDPNTGKMGVFVPDGKGGFIDTGTLVSQGNRIPTEGELAGSKYIVDEKATENGVPSLSLTPYTGSTAPTTPSTGPATMTPAEEAEYQKEIAAQKAKDEAALKVLDANATPTTNTAGTSTTLPTADFTGTKTTTAGTGGAPAGTNTNTTGAAGTTGTTGGASQG